jgi:Amt family ammonium transporter
MEFNNVDTLWVLLSAGLVLLMQPGFLALEAGMTRSKNAINVALKNVSDLGISIVIFWAFGFALMFGVTSGGWFGTTNFLVPVVEGGPNLATFFIFQAMFAGTAVTIVSGAVAERFKFGAYLMVAFIIVALIYPLFGHWAWGGVLEGDPGWLGKLGFVDFAGSTVVHGIGAWSALALVIVVGARTGRFNKDGSVRDFTGSNVPVAMIGVLLLWVGWFGFNGGSTLALNESVPAIIATTGLAGAAGLVTAHIVGYWRHGYFKAEIPMNGALAGLVAITAGTHAVSGGSAVVIGAIGAIVMVGALELLNRFKLDDAVGAIPVHGAAGVWGTIAVGIFGDPEILGTGLGRVEQVGVQTVGVTVAFVLGFGVTYVIAKVLDRIIGLRVSAEDELSGLNVAEHRATTESLDLLTIMANQAESGDMTERVQAEPFTEVGQIAGLYNQVLDRLDSTSRRMTSVVEAVSDGLCGIDISGKITFANPASGTGLGTSAAELTGKNFCTLVHGIQVAREPDHACPILAVTRTGVAHTSENDEFTRVDGSRLSTAYAASAVRDDSGDLVGAVITFRDISERKASENELRNAMENAELSNRDLASANQKSIESASVATELARKAREGMARLSGGLSKTVEVGHRQESAMGTASSFAHTVENASNAVVKSAQVATSEAHGASNYSETGVSVLNDTVDSLERIKSSMGQADSAIQDLEEKSRHIASVVDVIDEIATQTNLLSLNAAIEAASAGEAGRGFAVVAAEVRKLAKNVKDATGEIGDVVEDITSSVKKAITASDLGTAEVHKGAELAERSSSAISSIRDSVGKVVFEIEQISDAAEQMSSSSAEMVEAMDEASEAVASSSDATRQMEADVAEVVRATEEIGESDDQTGSKDPDAFAA